MQALESWKDSIRSRAVLRSSHSPPSCQEQWRQLQPHRPSARPVPLPASAHSQACQHSPQSPGQQRRPHAQTRGRTALPLRNHCWGGRGLEQRELRFGIDFGNFVLCAQLFAGRGARATCLWLGRLAGKPHPGAGRHACRIGG